jgi:putative transposase
MGPSIVEVEDDRRGSHTEWDCKYHLAWTTKYRYQVLEGEVGQRCRELLREIARSREMEIYAGSINRDHVDMLIGIPPKLIRVPGGAVSEREKLSPDVKSDYGRLRKRFWGQHLWARRYRLATSGNVTDEVWKRYIEDQKPPQPNDDFNVV